jgi:hypothetical protein
MPKAALRTSPDATTDGADVAGHVGVGRSVRACATKAQNITNVHDADKPHCATMAR